MDNNNQNRPASNSRHKLHGVIHAITLNVLHLRKHLHGNISIGVPAIQPYKTLGYIRSCFLPQIGDNNRKILRTLLPNPSTSRPRSLHATLHAWCRTSHLLGADRNTSKKLFPWQKTRQSPKSQLTPTPPLQAPKSTSIQSPTSRKPLGSSMISPSLASFHH